MKYYFFPEKKTIKDSCFINEWIFVNSKKYIASIYEISENFLSQKYVEDKFICILYSEIYNDINEKYFKSFDDALKYCFIFLEKSGYKQLSNDLKILR